MPKTKPNVDAKAKKSVATNAMFNKVGKASIRQEKARHMKDTLGKSTMASKGSKGQKSKHRATRTTAHPLAADFAGKTHSIQSSHSSSKVEVATGSIENSREAIEEKALALLDVTYSNLSKRLVDSYESFDQREQDLIKVTDTIGNPLNEQELEWTSTDGKQSGKTMLGVRMKKFQRTIEAEERELEQQFDQWTSVQAEIRNFASLILGPDGLDNLLAGKFDPDSFINIEWEKMKQEIETQQKAFMEQIERAGQEAMEAMTESEKASSCLHFTMAR